MARESFSDTATAALINEGFVAIKVDREERPDVDAVYHMAHQLLRRSGGGWPLTILLSPQGMPFYSGTYFPSEAPEGPATFKNVLGSVGGNNRVPTACGAGCGSGFCSYRCRQPDPVLAPRSPDGGD